MLRTLVLGLCALAWTFASSAQAASRLFSDDSILHITVTAPFPTLVRAAKTSTNPFPATLAVTEGAGPAQSLPIQLRARGFTRRTAGFCEFPPLQLDFSDKAALHGTVFKGQHKLKLVTYCRNEGDYEQRIILEYLTYRLYNVLTPMSYRVRGAEVTYRKNDADAGVTRFGYLIEDLDEGADRNHSVRLTLKSHQITSAQFNPHAAGRAALFEFMISNLDWDYLAGPAGSECCHNARFLAPTDAPPLKGVVPIDYDFDYSGLIDAPYAQEPVGLPVSSVIERLYRGYCVSTGEMPAVIDEFRAHRAEMMALINDDSRLNQRFRDKATRFLGGFFALLDNPARVQSEIIKNCRQGLFDAKK